MPLTAKEMVRYLEINGFTKGDQDGSHLKMRNDQTGQQTIVPILCGDLKPGTEAAILRQAGLSRPDGKRKKQ